MGISPWALANAATAPTTTNADAEVTAFLGKEWQDDLARDPTRRTLLGVRGPATGWTSTTDVRFEEDAARARAKLERVEAQFGDKQLSAQARLDLAIYKEELNAIILRAEFRRDSYFFTRNTSDPYLAYPQLLISSHRIGGEADAQEYLARLRGLSVVLADAIEGTHARIARGIVLPAFNYADISANSRALIRGAPCDEGPERHSILKDFESKLGGSGLAAARISELADEAERVLRDEVCVAYRAFAATFDHLGRDAVRNDGLWSLKDGERLYRDAIAIHTSMSVEPGELHAIGLQEVARIERQIHAYMRDRRFDGNVGEFFASLRADPAYLLPQTAEGRAAYLAANERVMANAIARLSELFHRIPSTPLEIRAVEPEREQALGGAAFYTPPTGPDGAGIYYTGLADMARLPTWEIEPVAYHEGYPGHHFQVSLAREAGDRSDYRRHYHNSAYQEGWGLYAEGLGEALGGYQDDLSNLARLRLDLMRAVRVVVDSGFHHQRWDWERAATYISKHLGMPMATARREATRYMVWPGQGVAYKLGELEINRLREKAESELGAEFDVRDFHAAILDDGVVPFHILSGRVDAWIAAAKRRQVSR